MSTTIEMLVTYWSTNGGRLNAGASEAELAAFESKYDVRLPSDLRQALAAVNGFDGCDDQSIEFRTVQELSPLDYPWVSKDSPAEGYFEFADFLIHSHIYAIQLHRDPNRENSVTVFYDQNPIIVAASFTDFVQAYLNVDNSVLFPPLPAQPPTPKRSRIRRIFGL